METKIKRPPTVWITQILLIIFALFLIFVLTGNLAARFRSGEDTPVAGVLVVCCVTLGFLLFLLVAFWGLATRKSYGRWFSVAFLLLFWGMVLSGQLFKPAGPHQYYEYKNRTELVAAAIASVLFDGLFLIFILRLAFAKKVTRFFNQEKNQAEEHTERQIGEHN